VREREEGGRVFVCEGEREGKKVGGKKEDV